MIRIPGYIIKREIGSGGMASVHLAVQTSLEREVALKVMAPALVADQTFSKRFLREARTVAGLSHPNIVAIYDVGITKNQLHYFSMQYLAHGDLSDKFRASISESELIRILSGICSALQYAHGRGFVHRDVTPGNILFDASGTPILTDFGIARAVTQSTKITGTGVSVGTSHYMSPEQARGRDVDPRSDIYSLGSIVFEALAGRPPYDGEDGFAIAYSHVFDPVPTLPTRFSRWQPFIDRAMAKDPEERFESAEDVASEMNSLLGSLTGEGRRPPPLVELLAVGDDATEQLPDVVERIAEPTTDERKRLRWTDRFFSFLPAPWRIPGAVTLGLALLGVIAWQLYPTLVSQHEQVALPANDVAQLDRPESSAAEPTVIDEPNPAALPTTVDAALAADTIVDRGFEGLDPAGPTTGTIGPAVPGDEADSSSGQVPASEVDTIAELLATAERQFEANQLTSPAGDNALESYQAVLAKDGENRSAQAGTERIIDRYLGLANRAVERGQLSQAATLVYRAQNVVQQVPTVNPALSEQLTTASDLVTQRLIRDARAATADTEFAAAETLLSSALQLQPENSAAIAASAELRTEQLRDRSTGDNTLSGSQLLRDPLSSGGYGPPLVAVAFGPFELRDADSVYRIDSQARVAVGVTEVTIAQYRLYAESDGYRERRSSCRDGESTWRSSRSRTWLAPGYEQGEDHPVTCISWQEAVDFVEWLSAETGHSYRLLSETEWDFLYQQQGRSFTSPDQYCEQGNVADRWLRNKLPNAKAIDCEDGWAYTSPVSNYPADVHGAYDLVGNLREWVTDCWRRERNVADFRVNLDGDCGNRVVKGIAWLHSDPAEVEQVRRAFPASVAFNTVGFRVARTLD